MYCPLDVAPEADEPAADEVADEFDDEALGPCLDTLVSTQQCTRCKCRGASAGTNSGERTQEECAQAAWDGGYTWYSWRGDQRFCVYGDDFSNDDVCGPNQENPPNDNWGIYTISCEEGVEEDAVVDDGCGLVLYSPECGGCKCGNAARATHTGHNDVDSCAEAAYEAGETYFSFRSDKRFCYFGGDSCEPGNRVGPTNVNWRTYEVSCGDRRRELESAKYLTAEEAKF